MKKLFSFLLIAAMLLAAFPTAVFAVEAKTETLEPQLEDIAETETLAPQPEDIAEPEDLEPQHGIVSGEMYPGVVNQQATNPVKIKVYKTGDVAWLYPGTDKYDADTANAARNDANLIVHETVVATDGTFSLSLPVGTYDILFDRNGYLDYIITEIPLELLAGGTVNSVYLGDHLMIPGDIVSDSGGGIQVGIKDGIIDMADLVALSDYFRSNHSSSDLQKLEKMLDFDDNKLINAMDMTLLMIYMGSTVSVASGTFSTYAMVRARLLNLSITSVTNPADITVPYNTAAEDLGLPATVEVTLSDGTKISLSASWITSSYNKELPAVPQTITGNIYLYGIENPSKLTAKITVIVDPPPVEVTYTTKIVAGTNHVVAISDIGKITANGKNNLQQINNIEDAWNGLDDHVIDIYAAGNNTVGLTEGGKVLAVGEVAKFSTNKSIIESWENVQSVAVGYFVIAAVFEDGSVQAVASTASGSAYNLKEQIIKWTNIEHVAVGKTHAIGMTKDGAWRSVSMNSKGVAMSSDIKTNVSSWNDIQIIEAEISYTASVDEYNILFVTGEYGNASGEIEIPINMEKRVAKIYASEDRLLILTTGGILRILDTYENQQEDGYAIQDWLEDIYDWTNIQGVAAGSDFVAAFDGSGAVHIVSLNGSIDMDTVQSWRLITAE